MLVLVRSRHVAGFRPNWMFVSVSFQKPCAPSQCDAGQERDRQAGSVVTMEVEFRQEITGGDTQKGASGET